MSECADTPAPPHRTFAVLRTQKDKAHAERTFIEHSSPCYNVGLFPADNRGRYGDGKGKGWMAVGRMSLTRLRFSHSRRTPLPALPTERSMISMSRPPSAIPTSPEA